VKNPKQMTGWRHRLAPVPVIGVALLPRFT
jgi:hypothetical protein